MRTMTRFLTLFLFLGSSFAYSDSLWQTTGHQNFSLFVSFNPDYPSGANDGPLWQGRGFNTSLQGGAEYRWGPLSLMLYPEVDLSQNLAYDTLGGLGDYGVGLDRVQRYGESSVVHLDWGSTEVRYTNDFVSVGVGTVPLILGAASRNHIILSNNAGGFPHLDLGTPGPLQTRWGDFEGTLLWGMLSDSSGYTDFETISPDSLRFFHALVLGYSPPFWPELTLGGARAFQSPWTTITPFKVFESLVDTMWKADRGAYNGANGEEDIDQVAALYFELHYLELGLEAYLELARNDHASGLKDFLRQPDHSMGYVAGLRKTFVTETGAWDVSYEQANLGLNYGTLVRPTGSWYRRAANEAGYTLGGQVLGAAIGPGSNSNFLELGYSWDLHRVFSSVERIANDVDYWIQATNPPDAQSADFVTLITLGGWTAWEDWGFSGSLTWWHNANRYWDATNDVTTWRVTLGVSWKMPKQ